MHLQAVAQICQGSLGDPVVNITFGTGQNPGPQLPASVTNYTFVFNGCPNDGQYTIANSSSGCFGGSWFTVSQDHTPNDQNGYMMIVNASNAPGQFYLDTVNGLCGNTNYEFAAWVLNIHNGFASTCNSVILPNVTFRIETTTGTVLQTFQTGNISAPQFASWTQYGFNFTTPPGTGTVVLRMNNNAPGGCGNDLVLDDITFRPCGPAITASITGMGVVRDLCVGDLSSTQLIANVTSGYVNPYYQWQRSLDGAVWTDITGANSVTYNTGALPTAANYYFRLTVAEAGNASVAACRIASNAVTIRVNKPPVPMANNNGPKCVGELLQLSATDAATYLWTGPAGFTSNAQAPQISVTAQTNAGTYYVMASSGAGCTTRDSTFVFINAMPVASAGKDTVICEGNATFLAGSGGTNYKWTPAAGLSADNIPNPVASPADSTYYTLSVSNGTCTDRDSVLVAVIKKPVANAGPDVFIFQGNQAVLQGSARGTNLRYNWTPALNIIGVDQLTPSVSPPGDTSYRLKVISNDGCGEATDDVFVRVFQKVIVPNAFSPNNDGINDTWHIEGLLSFSESDLLVFDRYGRQIFSSHGYLQPWNGLVKGKPLPIGTYYYLIDLKNKLPQITGSVTILR